MPESPPHVITAAAEQLAKQVHTRLLIAVGVITAAIVALAVVLTFALIEIQDSRYNDCVQSNHRHDQTLAFIRHLARQESKGASKAKRASLAVALHDDSILIQDLSPHTNCTRSTN